MGGAFHQLSIHPNSRDITAFTIQGEPQYHWLKLPLGMTQSPAIFRRVASAT